MHPRELTKGVVVKTHQNGRQGLLDTLMRGIHRWQKLNLQPQEQLLLTMSMGLGRQMQTRSALLEGMTLQMPVM